MPMKNKAKLSFIDNLPITLVFWLALVAIKLVLHLLWIDQYGYHGDELYFIESGRNLAFGYVDNPPLVPWIAQLAETIFGSAGLLSIRTLPVLAGAATIILTGLITRELGGNRLAQLLAGTCVLIAPLYLQMSHMLNIRIFELFFWTLASYVLVLLIKRERPQLWLVIGLVSGFGLLTKYSFLLWGVGMLMGWLILHPRKVLQDKNLWLGGLLALMIILPNMIWQINHNWVSLEFLRQLQITVRGDISRVLFLLGQFLYLHPLSAVVWLAGFPFFFTRSGRKFQPLAWIFLIPLVFFLINGGKPYYLAPAYPGLFAGGAVWITQRHSKAKVKVFLTLLLIVAIPTTLIAMPILPLETLDNGIARLLDPISDNQTLLRGLTGDFHAQYGWPEQAKAVATIFHELLPTQQQSTLIFTRHYNQASAINFFGEADQLPRAISGHMNYYLWGIPNQEITTLIAYGFDDNDLALLCDALDQVGLISHPLAKAKNNNLPVYLCSTSRATLLQQWVQFQRFDHNEPEHTK